MMPARLPLASPPSELVMDVVGWTEAVTELLDKEERRREDVKKNEVEPAVALIVEVEFGKDVNVEEVEKAFTGGPPWTLRGSEGTGLSFNVTVGGPTW